MRKMLLKFCLLTVFSLLCTNPGAMADQWTPPINESPENAGLNVVETFFNTGESISRLQAGDSSFTNADFNTRLCNQMGEFPCDGSIKTASYSAYEVLPPCSTEITEWCIEGLSVYKKENISIAEQAKLIRSTAGPTLNKDLKTGLPQGGTISLWKADGQVNSGGTQTYAVYAHIQGNAQADGKFFFNTFRAMVLPYSEKPGNRYSSGSVVEEKSSNGKTFIGIRGAAQECAWTENGNCGLLQDFPSEGRARLSIRIGNSLSGWLMGRMTDPNLEVKQISDTQNLITVDSEPAVVPKFYVSIPKSQIPPEITAIDPSIIKGVSGVRNQLAYSTKFELANEWAKLTDDKAAGLFTTWSISSTSTGKGSPCLNDTSKLLGVVSTNAMIYEGNAPSFVDGSLNYRVYGMHYNPDGSVFKGKYDLLVRSETARCLYGFSTAPISASISVTSTSGDVQTTTNFLTEKSGWLHLGAYGFTFSSPTIKIKLNQTKETARDVLSENKSVEVDTKAEPSTPLVQPKQVEVKKSLTCVKGKLMKKVTAVKPKCPAGYKKK